MLEILPVVMGLLTALPVGNLLPVLQSLLSAVLSLSSGGLNPSQIQAKLTSLLAGVTP